MNVKTKSNQTTDAYTSRSVKYKFKFGFLSKSCINPEYTLIALKNATMTKNKFEKKHMVARWAVLPLEL